MSKGYRFIHRLVMLVIIAIILAISSITTHKNLIKVDATHQTVKTNLDIEQRGFRY